MKWITALFILLMITIYPFLVSQSRRPRDFNPVIEHSKLTTENLNTNIMKQCTLKFPVSKSKEVSKFLAENGIVTNLSYLESDGFFDKTVTAIICFPDDKEDKVKANLQKWIKE